jgi:hypothetical protein
MSEVGILPPSKEMKMRTLTDSELDVVSGGATLQLALQSAAALGAASGSLGSVASNSTASTATGGLATGGLSFGAAAPSLGGTTVTVLLTS